ncbi:MAG: TlpA disulfide reductase family protein [Prolixibacteraceae bacterium]|jgi:peroxiredoxin
MKVRHIASILILLIVSVLKGFAQEETTHVKITDKVPPFEYEKSPGKIQNISGLKGKIVLITFFATWCGPCRKELPFIQSDIYNKYKKNPNFEILIFGREHNWEEVNKFKDNNKFTMPFYPDPERKIYSKFAGQYIPRNFLISPEGTILFSSIGFNEKDFKSLKDAIENQLKNQ